MHVTQLQSCVRLFESSWTLALQAPLSMEFPRQEYWSEFYFLLWVILPTQGLNPHLLLWQACSLLPSHQESCISFRAIIIKCYILGGLTNRNIFFSVLEPDIRDQGVSKISSFWILPLWLVSLCLHMVSLSWVSRSKSFYKHKSHIWLEPALMTWFLT